MSKIKTLLPEDYEPRYDTLEPDYEPIEDEAPEEYAIYHSLESDTCRLMELVLSPQNAHTIRNIADRLNMLADKAEQPF